MNFPMFLVYDFQSCLMIVLNFHFEKNNINRILIHMLIVVILVIAYSKQRNLISWFFHEWICIINYRRFIFFFVNYMRCKIISQIFRSIFINIFTISSIYLYYVYGPHIFIYFSKKETNSLFKNSSYFEYNHWNNWMYRNWMSLFIVLFQLK